MADEKQVTSGQRLAGEKRLTRRQALAGAGATAIGLGLAACGSGSSGAKTTGASSSGAATTSSAARRGGNLRVAVEGNGLKDIMDAQNDLAKIDQARLVTGWEPLLEYDREFKLTTTGLAESVEAHGAAAYDIRVRKGIEFHNGKTLTADDVIYSLKRLTNKSLGLDGSTSVTSVDPHKLKKLDKYTVRVGLTQPDVTIPFGLGSYTCTIVPEGYTNKGRSWKDGQVGTGPFRLQSFTPGQQSVHTRFENYWQSGKPHLDQVTIVDINDASARMNGLISGQVDAIADVPYSQAKLITAQPSLILFNNEGGGWLTLCMRVDQKPFTDVRVRQAFRLIADRQQILEQALAGFGRVANDMYAPFDPAFLQEPQRTQDLEQAKSLLKAAGYSNLTIDLPTSEVATGLNEMCQVFAQQAKGAGVNVNVKVLDATTFNNGFQKWTFSPDFWGTRLYLPQVAQSELKGAPYNECHWPPPGSNFASLYRQALAEQDVAKRTDIIHAMMKEEFETGGYIIPMFDNLVDAYSKKVGGFQQNRGTLNLDYYGRHFADVYFL
jgi:peptide/nickel transport system substrate-binding protein